MVLVAGRDRKNHMKKASRYFGHDSVAAAMIAATILAGAMGSFREARAAERADEPVSKTGSQAGPPRRPAGLEKPDFGKLARPAADRFKCLVVFGLYTHILRLDDALADWRYRGKHAVEFTWANCPPNAVEGFPATYEELFSYHTIVLSDVNYRALGDKAFEMLCDDVEQGGALLVVGGPYALGNGEFKDTRFLELLPVKLQGPFDLKWAGRGKSWDLVPANAAGALLRGVFFNPPPKVFWHHFVTAKEGAQVHLTAGGQPALVTGVYGRGRVAVLTLSPTGKSGTGETAWWDWQGWFPLLRNTVAWLNHEEDQ
jgi:uncharacterized membrane protein